MRKYVCVKPLPLEQYDEEGYWMPGQAIIVEPGTELTESSRPLSLANPPAVRLERADGLWIEIYPDTLSKHFKEL